MNCGYCKDCKHWSGDDETLYSQCNVIEDEGGRFTAPVFVEDVVVGEIGDEQTVTGGRVITRGDFGCVLFEKE